MIGRILADTKIVKLFSPSQRLPFVEFIALMALTTSLVALTIDGMLPALPAIGQDLALADPNHTQLIVSMVFLGMAFGQLLFGPMSDSYGRKVALYAGMTVFMIGCLLSIFATDFNTMLIGRVLQGIGASAPRVVPMALIRDEYEGRAMARVMSLIMMVFILVPMLAPALGQLVLYIADWRSIFGSFLGLAVILTLWFSIRQPETLAPENRKPFSVKQVWLGLLEVCRIRTALGYTLAVGMVSGPFLTYLSTAQPVLQEQYGLGAQFSLYFAVLALSIGVASFVNSKLVMRFGMRFLSRCATFGVVGLSLLFLLPVYLTDGNPPLLLFMAYLVTILFCMGMLFGNLNTMAMEPLGHIAGIGAAVVGSLSTLISVPLGIAIGMFYDNSVMPLVVGFLVCALGALVLMRWAEAE